MCFRLVSPLVPDQQPKRVPDGHGRSYGSGPCQKEKCLGLINLWLLCINCKFGKINWQAKLSWLVKCLNNNDFT